MGVHVIPIPIKKGGFPFPPIPIPNSANHGNFGTFLLTEVSDGRTTCNLNTALCTKVHRAVKRGEPMR